MNETLGMAIRRAKAAGPQTYVRQRLSAPIESPPAVTVTTETRVPWQERPSLPNNAVVIKRVMNAVSLFYRMPMARITSKRRDKETCRARQVAVYLCRDLTDLSYPRIARHFNYPEHTAVLHGVRKISAMCAADLKVAQEIDDVKALIEGMK